LSKKLSQLSPGEGASVKSIDAGPLQAKLIEMGLYEGKEVKVLFRAPLGDPIAIDVEGYTLSLRKSEAQLVLVEAN
jgi:ferrous iron transport protein A